MSLVDVSDIVRMLADRVDDLVPSLLPAAVREGPEWRVGSIAGEKGRSMAINRTGNRAGVWADFSASEMRGDALELVAQVLFGGDKKQAISWAKSWLGIDNLDPARLKTVRRQVKQRAQKATESEQKRLISIRRMAKAIWLKANDDVFRSPVDLYLLGRGISIAELPRQPSALRYAQQMQYKDPASGAVSYWPAMVAAIYNGSGEFLGIHRTFLQNGGLGKAPVRDPKLTLGSYRGGFISLARGKSDKPIAQAPDGDCVIICEGIEDGLTIAQACPDYRVLAAISVGNFQNIVLPKTIKHVVIFADNDGAGSKADLSLQNAIDVFLDQGRSVSVARAPDGCKDANDIVRQYAQKDNKNKEVVS